LLAGRIFDDRGNRMTPSHVRKRGIKYRYYLSSALLQGQPERAGAVSRIPAAEIEGLVVRSVRDHRNQSEEIEDAVLINTHVARIEVQAKQLLIELTNAKGIGSKQSRSRNTLTVPWHKTPLRRRREILVPASPPQDARAIRSENRALLISSIARGRRWLNELIADPTANAASIAARDSRRANDPGYPASHLGVHEREQGDYLDASRTPARPILLPRHPPARWMRSLGGRFVRCSDLLSYRVIPRACAGL
jgi:site-specific DNA recombinase